MKLFTKITIIIFIGILLVTVIVTSNEDNGGPLGRKTVAEMDQRVKAYGVENVRAFVNTKTHTIGYYDVIDPSPKPHNPNRVVRHVSDGR